MTRAIVVMIALAGCGSASSPKPAGSHPQGVAGYYEGNWGELVLRQEGDSVRGTYSHDQGTFTGKFVGDTLVGWWCEMPSRQPDKDAGELELHFITKDGSLPEIDGHWRYGASGAWRDNWDLTMVAGEPDPALTARFDDVAAFCTHP